MKPTFKYALYCLLAILVVSLRLIYLDADPPQWLSWSTGIYSDEGIYSADARSVVLFGHWCSGNFHSAEIAPLHHLLLLGVLRLFGVSLYSARLLGVAASLGTIFLLFLTLKAQYNENTAAIGAIFLGISPIALFYSRLDLLETPTAFLLTAAFYLIVTKRSGWLVGLALALAVCYKPLAVLCLPAFFVDYRKEPLEAGKRLASIFCGLVLFFLLWQFPHHAELSRLNHHYLFHQYLPHSLAQLRRNIVRSLWSGAGDGVFPYLVRHAPILLITAAAAIVSRKLRSDSKLRSYILWAGVPLIALCLISYSPSRYYILFWPGLCALAAIATAYQRALLRYSIITAYAVFSIVTITLSLIDATYEFRDSGKAIGNHFGQSVVLVGQYAPELALSNNLKCLYVQPGLANSRGDLNSSIVLITPTPLWSTYWKTRTDGALVPASLRQYPLPQGQSVTAWKTP
jgi:4-amino-4-deoxy-L-arabinose transferase-like glycosyltransferase